MNLVFFVSVIKIHYKTLLFKTVKTDTETEAPVPLNCSLSHINMENLAYANRGARAGQERMDYGLREEPNIFFYQSVFPYRMQNKCADIYM